MENITRNVKFTRGDSLKVEVSRGMRGGYGWTITVRGVKARSKEALKRIKQIDSELRKTYPEE